MTRNFLCTVYEFENIVGEKKAKTVLKKMKDVLVSFDNKVYLNPIEIIQSFCEFKKEVDEKSIILDRFTAVNLSTWFDEDDESDYRLKKMVLNVFKYAFKYTLKNEWSENDVCLRFIDICGLYNGYRDNINSHLDSLDRIICGVFTSDNEKRVLRTLQQEIYI